jgi:aminoglycoside phosphotransferase (APT) family kinase protein
MPQMHKGQVETSPDLVTRLLAGQFPEWLRPEITLVESFGTDHDIYRVGNELCVRLPKIDWATAQAEKEGRWLPQLADRLPVRVPRQLGIGSPAEGYPFTWSVCEWISGTDAHHARVDLERLAVDLAAFVTALRKIDTAGAPERPKGARGCPLSEVDEAVRRSMAALEGHPDIGGITHLWSESLGAAAWDGQDVWVHGDLLAGNLIVRERRLHAVIDWGTLNVGDPACDLLAAWNVFSGSSRAEYLEALTVDDDTWLRGRGWAIYQAVMALPYYRETNPGMVRQATHALEEVIADSR